MHCVWFDLTHMKEKEGVLAFRLVFSWVSLTSQPLGNFFGQFLPGMIVILSPCIPHLVHATREPKIFKKKNLAVSGHDCIEFFSFRKVVEASIGGSSIPVEMDLSIGSVDENSNRVTRREGSLSLIADIGMVSLSCRVPTPSISRLT